MLTSELEDKVWTVPILLKITNLSFMTLSQTDQHGFPFHSPYYVHSLICSI